MAESILATMQTISFKPHKMCYRTGFINLTALWSQ